MVARHGTDWRERPNAAMGLAHMQMIRAEWEQQWQRCQRLLARTPKQPKPALKWCCSTT